MYQTYLTETERQIYNKIVGICKSESENMIWNAIFYVVKTGCQWRMLPKEFPKWESVYCIVNFRVF